MAKKFKIETSWDDGKEQDIRLYELLKKYNLPAIFYIPYLCGISENDIIKISEDFEIGGHTISHAPLTRVNKGDAWHEISRGKELMENMIGKTITSFCYPKGHLNDNIVEMVKKAGFNEGRTTKVLSLGDRVDPFRKPTTIHAFQRAEYRGKDWLGVALDYLKKAKEEKKTFHLWGHSWEVDRDNNWEKLETLFKKMSEAINENTNT